MFTSLARFPPFFRLLARRDFSVVTQFSLFVYSFSCFIFFGVRFVVISHWFFYVIPLFTFSCCHLPPHLTFQFSFALLVYSRFLSFYILWALLVHWLPFFFIPVVLVPSVWFDFGGLLCIYFHVGFLSVNTVYTPCVTAFGHKRG